ncbi:hypothetical protein [Mycolicibacterium porcinum]|uniref:Uncharacterized protein n=1 Tax=Mycolicibacterium porcinum TaxID=39693 RepID=A0ABV3VLN1_9MYCO
MTDRTVTVIAEALASNLVERLTAGPRWVSSEAIAEILNDEARNIVAALKAAGIAVVKLPKSPSEYWGPEHQPQWNHYPFTRVCGNEVEVGARCEHVFRINVTEARVFAADVLAAADIAESSR